jgi:hypothetical protein
MSTRSKLQAVEGAELMAIEGGHHHHGHGGGGGLGGVGGLLGSLGGGLVNLSINVINNIAVVAGNFLGAGSSIGIGQQAGGTSA